MTHRNIDPFMGDTAKATGLTLTAEQAMANPREPVNDYGMPGPRFYDMARNHPRFTPVVTSNPAANSVAAQTANSGEYILYGAGLAGIVAGIAGIIKEGNTLPLPGNPTPAEYGAGLLIGGAAMLAAGLQYSRLQRMSARLEGFVAENTRNALEGLRASKPIDRAAIVQMRADIVDRERNGSYGS